MSAHPAHPAHTAEPVTSLTVPFSGLRAGTAPMSWGQRAIWKSIAWLKEEAHYFNTPRVVRIPDGTTTDRAVAAIAGVLTRHEALRTTFADGPDGGTQTVHGEGEVTVEVHATAAPLPEEEAAAFARRLAATAFRHADEFGMRYALLTYGGRPVWLVLVVSHQVSDFWGVRVLERDLDVLLRGGDLEEDAAWQPLDQARHQQEGVGARRGREALAHWERTLTSVPASLFDAAPPEDGVADDDPERFVRLRLASPAGAVAAERLADRCRVSTGTVLLTAAAAVLAAYTGHEQAVLLLIAGNRNEPRLKGMVGAQTENALFVMEPGDGTFEDAVRGGFLTAMTAYRHGEYDPVAMDEVHARVRRARGTDLDLSAFFNDVRMRDRWEALPDVAPDDAAALEELRARSEISTTGTWPRQDAKYFVHTEYAPDRLHLYLMADTHHIPRATMPTLLRAMETLLVASAHGETKARPTLP
ncbi:condensation domain-containing protein [Streptomyces sp. TRM64462]|uniref:condensation domain-containing protein n=1 Tax=Streptomyces sp. TRM64462 TaxID=2741726 RepID=UPI001586CCFD|nr:condensation domain-containing protein [Streptomyces sp. TRM64462]